MPPRQAPDGTATLRSVLALGAGEALELVRAPRGTDVAVRDVVMLDPGDLARAARCVVLAVGVDPAAPAAVEAVRAAAAAGAAALVLRSVPDGGVPAVVLAAAERHGLALLVRAAAVDWADAAGAVRGAVAYASDGGDGSPGVRPGDLAALADLVARLTGGSVVIEDNSSRVLAHSHTGMDADERRRQTILGGRVPASRVRQLRRSGLIRAVLASPGAVYRPASDGEPERVVVAVRAGTEVLGSLWLAPDGAALAQGAGAALELAARMAVPHLLRHRLRDRAAEGQRSDTVRALLAGRGDAAAHAAALGLPDGPCAVIVVTAAGAGGPGAAGTLEALAAHAGAARHGTHVLCEESRLLVVLPVPPVDGAAVAAASGRQLALLADALAPRAAVLVGVGPVVEGPGAVPGSLGGAELVERVLRAAYRPGGSSRAADVRESAVPVTLLRVLDAAGPAWRAGAGALHDLAAHEREHGGELLESLAVYLDAFGDVASAADRLGVHANTLRYRLRRLRERFGVDVADPDVRLLALVAARLPGVLPSGGA